MATYLQQNGRHASALMCILEAHAPKAAQDFAKKFGDLATNLASAVALHIDCDARNGWYDDMEILAIISPKGSSIDACVGVFLSDLFGIAFETGMPNVSAFADQYVIVVREAAEAVAVALKVSVVATASSCDSIYAPFAVFGPAFKNQPAPPSFSNQIGDKWHNAAAYIDTANRPAAEISATRRKSLKFYRRSPIWPNIEANLLPIVA